jgi:hypothetical protein
MYEFYKKQDCFLKAKIEHLTQVENQLILKLVWFDRIKIVYLPFLFQICNSFINLFQGWYWRTYPSIDRTLTRFV